MAQQELSVFFLLRGILKSVETFNAPASEMGTRIAPTDAAANCSDGSADASANSSASRPEKCTDCAPGERACLEAHEAASRAAGYEQMRCEAVAGCAFVDAGPADGPGAFASDRALTSMVAALDARAGIQRVFGAQAVMANAARGADAIEKPGL
jgi:hypothetical protein